MAFEGKKKSCIFEDAIILGFSQPKMTFSKGEKRGLGKFWKWKHCFTNWWIICVSFYSLKFIWCSSYRKWIDKFHTTLLQTHHLVLALIANGPCDVILAPALFALFNLPLIFSMLCMEFSQVLMVIERTLASCLFVCYEKTTKTIGFVLTSFAVRLCWIEGKL